MLVRPAAAGKYPLVLMNHGAPRKPADRAGMTPLAFLPQMMEFARRGCAVAAVMRRGFGDSGGGFAETAGTCQNPDYLASGRSAAKDLRAAIEYLSRRPDIDATRIMSVGQSAGGFCHRRAHAPTLRPDWWRRSASQADAARPRTARCARTIGLVDAFGSLRQDLAHADAVGLRRQRSVLRTGARATPAPGLHEPREVMRSSSSVRPSARTDTRCSLSAFHCGRRTSMRS